MSPKTSRQRLFEYLQHHSPITPSELSRALRMTEANARHHLAILREMGLVEMLGNRAQKGKGRPSQLFAPSPKILGNNVNLLANALLHKIKDEQNPSAFHEMLKRIARSLGDGEGKGFHGPDSFNLTQRLFLTVQRLNELNYQARWEAHRESPRVIITACPYASLLTEHPELCFMDAFLLEYLLGQEVQQTSWISSNGIGSQVCRFKVRA